MRIVLACGSRRRASLNARLLGALAAALPYGVSCDRIQPLDLPLFDGDSEDDPAILAQVHALHARILAADALIVASPEYNGLMTPYLKNWVDWVSRLPHRDRAIANAFADKPLLLAATTPGSSGGAVAIPACRALFGYCGAIVFGEAIAVPWGEQAIRPDGTLDPQFAGDWWRDGLRRFVDFAARLRDHA